MQNRNITIAIIFFNMRIMKYTLRVRIGFRSSHGKLNESNRKLVDIHSLAHWITKLR